MKTQNLIAWSACLIFVHLSNGQGTFQNLNFEQASPVSAGDPFNPNAVTAASAFPYWSVYSGNVQQTEVNFNDPDAGTTTVGLVNPSSPFFPGIDDYSVLLQGGFTASSASISQTGMIPSGTESLLFEAQPAAGPLDVFIGTQSVSFSAVETGPDYTLYSANISAWGGDTESLTFSAPEGYGGNNWVIDDISFSPNTVPEPSILVLTTIGGLIFGARKWFARR